MESVTTSKLKQWDRDRVHQLKQKEEEEEKKAWDKMYQIQVKAILCEKWPLYCPEGSGTLRQQLLMMH